MMNKILLKSARIETHGIISVYVLFDGNKLDIYTTFEKIAQEKVEARKNKEDITRRKYIDVNEALKYAREVIGENFYIEPKAKVYIEKLKEKSKNTPSPSNTTYTKGESSISLKIKEEEESLKTQTYKTCLLKGVDLKVNEKLEHLAKLWKE
jgi:hypothetical protein